MSGAKPDNSNAVGDIVTRLDAAQAPVLMLGRDWPLEVAREAILLAVELRAAIVVETPPGWDRGGIDAPELSFIGAAKSEDMRSIAWSAASQHQAVEIALEAAMMRHGDTPTEKNASVELCEDLFRSKRVHLDLDPAIDHAVLRDCLGDLAARERGESRVSYGVDGEAGASNLALEVLTWLTNIPGTLRWLAVDGGDAVEPYWTPGRFSRSDSRQPTDLLIALNYDAAETQPDNIVRLVLSELANEPVRLQAIIAEIRRALAGRASGGGP